MPHVQKLALVLLQALDLHVEDGVGVEDDALGLLGVKGELLLVGALDLLQTAQHGGVFGVLVQLRELFGLEQVVPQRILADKFQRIRPAPD